MYRHYHSVNLIPILTTRPAFNSTNNDKLPIFKQSNLIYIFVCRYNSTYIAMTCQSHEVRVKQHIHISLLSGRITSRHSQTMDSAIGEHLLTINSCKTSYKDDCFSVLHSARDKSYLIFPEAIYISMNHPSLCGQLNNYTLNNFGELLDTGMTVFFLWGGHLLSGNPKLYNIYPRFYLIIRCIKKTWKAADEMGFVCFIILLKFSAFFITNCVFANHLM